MHYLRVMAHGSPDDPRPVGPAEVLTAYTVRGPGCWPWQGSITSLGYGTAPTGHRGRSVLAHRLAYVLAIGVIPPGLVIDHTCHNFDRSCPGGAQCLHRRCVNPAHLEAVTLAENVRRGSHRRAKEVVPHGS